MTYSSDSLRPDARSKNAKSDFPLDDRACCNLPICALAVQPCRSQVAMLQNSRRQAVNQHFHTVTSAEMCSGCYVGQAIARQSGNVESWILAAIAARPTFSKCQDQDTDRRILLAREASPGNPYSLQVYCLGGHESSCRHE